MYRNLFHEYDLTGALGVDVMDILKSKLNTLSPGGDFRAYYQELQKQKFGKIKSACVDTVRADGRCLTTDAALTISVQNVDASPDLASIASPPTPLASFAVDKAPALVLSPRISPVHTSSISLSPTPVTAIESLNRIQEPPKTEAAFRPIQSAGCAHISITTSANLSDINKESGVQCRPEIRPKTSSSIRQKSCKTPPKKHDGLFTWEGSLRPNLKVKPTAIHLKTELVTRKNCAIDTQGIDTQEQGGAQCSPVRPATASSTLQDRLGQTNRIELSSVTVLFLVPVLYYIIFL